MLEVEVKYACPDFAPVEAALTARGVEWRGEQREEDLYFNAPDRDFKSTDEALRIRTSGAGAVVTYKGPKRDTATKTREEVELPIGSADDWRVLFTKLGYRASGVVRKIRRIGKVMVGLWAVQVCLDEVENVGRYVEFEVVTEESGYAPARDAVLRLAHELGFREPERRSYLSMTLGSADGGNGPTPRRLQSKEPPMRIECDIEGIDPQPVLFTFFERVLRHSAQRISFDLSLIDRVIIVSPDRFGAAVASIRPGATHTNTETMVAAGKTLSRRAGERIVSDIVFQCCLFENLAVVLGDPPTSTVWEIDQQQASYVICHEFGHALDNSLRNDMDSVPDPRARPFSIKETADFFGDIVLTEYAACRNSASAMTDPLFHHEMQETGTRLAECIRQVNQALDNTEKLTPRALAQFAWVCMAEFAKFYGYATANASHRVAIRERETKLVGGTPLGDALDRIGASYPNWDIPSYIPELTDIWHTYARKSNVRFVARDGGADVMEDMRKGN